MLDNPLAFLVGHPAVIVAAVFAAAVLEYVFPPFWGDTMMLGGCVLAGTHHVSAWAVFAAAVAGSSLGACAAYYLGHHFGRASLRLAGRRAQRWAEKAERLCQAHGLRVVAVNRFLPGLRAFLMPLAGLGKMPLGAVLAWATLSNVMWCGLLLAIGLLTGSQVQDFAELQGSFRGVALLAGAGAFAILLALTARAVLQRRRVSAQADSLSPS